jgi:hypothetical protein
MQPNRISQLPLRPEKVSAPAPAPAAAAAATAAPAATAPAATGAHATAALVAPATAAPAAPPAPAAAAATAATAATAPTAAPPRFVVFLFEDADNNPKIGLGQMHMSTTRPREGFLHFVRLALTQAYVAPPDHLGLGSLYVLPTRELDQKPIEAPEGIVLVLDAKLDSVGGKTTRIPLVHHS